MSRSFDLLVNLAACVQSEIDKKAADQTVTPVTVEIQPGDHVVSPITDEGCSKAWVRLLTGYMAESVGNESVQDGNCGKLLGLEIEVGILRCMTWGDEDGNPPDAETNLTAFKAQCEDMDLMLRAINCCEAVNDNGLIVRGFQPYGPRALLVGGSWSLATVI